MILIYSIFAFLFGTVVGSFLNVAIHRLPQGLSVVAPPSHCPHCKTPIRWFDNLPLLSFIALKGKCRHCGATISSRYFLVELLSGILWLSLWMVYGFSWIFAAGIIFFSLLLVALVTDRETGLIPDKVTFFGMGAGLLLSALSPGSFGETSWFWGLSSSFLGLLVGGSLILAIGTVGTWVFKKDSMGGGDVKLMAMIGSFLGWQSVILVFFTAPFFALPAALYSRFFKKEETIPYGPFLALAAMVHFFCGRLLWHLLGLS